MNLLTFIVCVYAITGLIGLVWLYFARQESARLRDEAKKKQFIPEFQQAADALLNAKAEIQEMRKKVEEHESKLSAISLKEGIRRES